MVSSNRSKPARKLANVLLAQVERGFDCDAALFHRVVAVVFAQLIEDVEDEVRGLNIDHFGVDHQGVARSAYGLWSAGGCELDGLGFGRVFLRLGDLAQIGHSGQYIITAAGRGGEIGIGV